MLSNSSKYALNAVIYLTLHSDEDHKLQAHEISKNIGAPKAYTGKLLQSLARQGIVSSVRGPKGGFYVSESNKKYSVMDVIEVIDGRIKIESCVLGLSDCDPEKPCPLHNLIASSRSKMVTVFEQVTLEELALSLKDRQSFLPG